MLPFRYLLLSSGQKHVWLWVLCGQNKGQNKCILPSPPHTIYSILIFLLVSAYEFLMELFNDVSSMGSFKIYLIYHFFPL